MQFGTDRGYWLISATRSWIWLEIIFIWGGQWFTSWRCSITSGKLCCLTSYVDANIFRDQLTGSSITGILHLVSKTPVGWYSKKYSTVETSTYGSEFVSDCNCVERIIYLSNNIWYICVTILHKSYMFLYNKTFFDNDIHPHAELHKCHTNLYFYRVW